jgi:hypothetical protein
MLIFLDESFRKNVNTGSEYGVLAGVAIPEDTYHQFQHDFFYARKPYHGLVLKEDDEIHGKELLNKATLKRIAMKGSSYHWNLAAELLAFARNRGNREENVLHHRCRRQSANESESYARRPRQAVERVKKRFGDLAVYG